MPKCQNCDHTWSWLGTVKIGIKNNKKCSNCGKRQYVSAKSGKKQYAVYFFLLIALVFSRPLFDLSNMLYIPIGALFIIGMFMHIPYTIQLSNEQKPIW